MLHVRAFRPVQPLSGVVISHIRKGTQGRLAMKNCQPFARELGGRMHVFAHNGDLDMAALRARMPLRRFHPVGDTDSEHAFCALLDRLRAPSPLHERFAVVVRFAAVLRALGPANFLYSDGDALFIHGHTRRHRPGAPAEPPGLHMLRRRCAPGQQVVLAASVPLTPEPGWQPLAEGELVVVQQGTVVARSCLSAPAHAVS